MPEGIRSSNNMFQLAFKTIFCYETNAEYNDLKTLHERFVNMESHSFGGMSNGKVERKII